jgi:hypothetical protein
MAFTFHSPLLQAVVWEFAGEAAKSCTENDPLRSFLLQPAVAGGRFGFCGRSRKIVY